MSAGRRALGAFVAVLLTLVAALCGMLLHWPTRVTTAVACVVGALTAAVVLLPRRSPVLVPQATTLEPDRPVPPVERQEERLTGVGLPSTTPDYTFVFAATVRWHVLDSPQGAAPVHAASLAVEAVLERARAFAARQSPERAALVQYLLEGALATMRPDGSGRVLAMARDVVVRLPDGDRERLARLAAIRKDEALWEHERHYERSKRSYLGGDVLKDTGSAVVWWLARNEDTATGVEGAVDRIGASRG